MQDINNILAIVLCGGLGTRLRAVNKEQPKPMVLVAGRPFLEYILDNLIEQGISQVVLAVSYQKEVIIKHFGNKYKNLNIDYSIEDIPLGTGGAVKKALSTFSQLEEQYVLVVNGDTFVEYSLPEMYQKTRHEQADFVMALKNIEDTSRYGRVKLSDGKIIKFEEKKQGVNGYINAGIYLFKTSIGENFPNQTSFSFENDFLEKFIHEHKVQSSISQGYFIDIGVPEDYFQAQIDFKT